jgi:hypothetical protein
MFWFFFYKNYVSTTKINQLHQTAYLTSSIWQKSVTSNSLLDQQHMTKISYIKQPTWPAAYDKNQVHQTAYLTSSIWQKSVTSNSLAYLTSSIWQKSVTSNSLLDQQHMTKIRYIKQPTWPAAYDKNQLHQTAYLTSSIWQKSVTSNSLLDQQHMTQISYIKQPTWPAAYDKNRAAN